MKLFLAMFALTLSFSVSTPAKAHHHQDPLQGKAGNVSDTDVWRHFMLHLAREVEIPTSEGIVGNNDLFAAFTVARKFRAEFEKSIEDFNAAQENRVEADQIAAMKEFIAQRDAMVAKYKKELLSALPQETKKHILDDIDQSKEGIKSSGVGSASPNDCGVHDYITCSVTYSIYPVADGINPDGSFKAGWNQILDGAATMLGNPPHARHTPIVMQINDGKESKNSGKDVCADCYFYVNASVFFALREGSPQETNSHGIVICNEAGKFFDTEADSNSELPGRRKIVASTFVQDKK